jgi:hypothetical protein
MHKSLYLMTGSFDQENTYQKQRLLMYRKQYQVKGKKTTEKRISQLETPS